MSEEENDETVTLLKKTMEKLKKSDERQTELERKNVELEKRLAEMDNVLNPPEEPEKTEPIKTEDDPVHEWAKKQMVEREEKKKRVERKFRVKPKAEVEADADKLFQDMLLDGQE